MAYVLRYKPNGQYLNIGGRSTEPLNLGINPKIYKTKEEAQKIVDRIIDREIEQFRHFLDMGDKGLHVKGKPIWYDERHTKKLTKTQQKKLVWYENAVERNKRDRKFIDNFKISDVEVVEWKEGQ